MTAFLEKVYSFACCFIYNHKCFIQVNKLFLKLKRLLIIILGIDLYLKIVSKIYFQLYRFHLLWLFGNTFQEIKYLQNTVKKGWHCIDIGANLGYVTIPLSHLCGSEGKVLAVEPVKTFVDLLTTYVKKYGKGNVKILNYALGKNDNEKIIMGTPVIHGIQRHGFTKVVDSSSEFPYGSTYEVQMRNPMSLFKDIQQLDFLKCDVEGYEVFIIPEMKDLLVKFKPMILIEFGTNESRKTLSKFFDEIGYNAYYVEGGKLKPITYENLITFPTNNFILLPKTK
jgi:FkbM family methyltransferase